MAYDLALIDIGAVSVAFTDDFRNEIGEALLERHAIELFLTTKANAKFFPALSPHVAFIDGENHDLRPAHRTSRRHRAMSKTS